MKKIMMKYISVILMALTLINCIPINASAGFSDVPENADYLDALNRVVSLGIIADAENFNPDALLTREQFTKVIVVAAGLEDTAQSMKRSTIFPDIAVNAWSRGYINAAVNKGYITGWSDGKFHPTQAITFAQICTVLVKALGYTDQDVTGNWPNNYTAKAKELGLIDGITLGSNDSVPRWAVITMINRLLDTSMKDGSAAGGQTFIDTTGSYTKCIVFGDSSTIGYLQMGQVLTDKGTYNNPLNIKIGLGSENYLIVKNGNIQKASVQSNVLKISVDQSAENKVSYKAGNEVQSILLPDNITYYYQGIKTDYKNLAAILQKSTSIILNYTADKTGYSFAVIFDPVYSKPEIADSFASSSGKLGTITFGSNPLIMREGEVVGISQIEPKDVVYQVTDIWGANKYFQAVDNRISGEISAVTPNNLSPKTLQIDSVNYDLSQDIDLSKIAGSFGNIAVGNDISVYLGHDGKIVNVEDFGVEDNSNYAIVLNANRSVATNSGGINIIKYNVKLLFGNGATATYYVESNASGLKGSLVKYTLTDSDTATLENIPYIIRGETTIDQNQQFLGSGTVSDNVKIFNLVNNDTGSDVQANVLRWTDLPNGIIPSSKIWYTKTAGAFNDITLIVTDDILNQRYKLGIVTSVVANGNSTESTVLIDGMEYKYNAALPVGSAVKFKMKSTGIDSLVQIMNTVITSSTIQAIDGRRIKVDGTVYYFDNSFSIYYRDSSGVVTVKTLADIDTSKSYQKVSLYTYDINTGSKVSILLLDE